MGFHSIELLEKIRESKLFLKQVITNVHGWTVRIGISSDTGYSYLDLNRLDKNMPWILLTELDPRDADTIIEYINCKLAHNKNMLNDLLPKTNVNTIMKQFSAMMHEFTDLSKAILKAVEGGHVSMDDIKNYERKRAALSVAEIRLFKLIKAVAGDKWEGVL